ncbi:MAG: aspartyl protease family protein [Flavobacteriaceae bacterium]|nr:aspartyl protease family protein [Flavobacteriaceae bacterium]
MLKAQGKFMLQNVKSDKVDFELINNLIIVPVEVNGVKLSFLLDTGVSKPIIFNLLNVEKDLKINQAERIFLRGLGEGESIEALKSRNNIIKIGEALSISQEIYAVFDSALNFAPRLGVPIHGIIGYDFFKDFIIEVNYTKRQLKIHDPKFYKAKKCKKCIIEEIEFFNNKPYITGYVKLNEQRKEVKLLVDTGGSDALWLFEDEENGMVIPEKNFEDFLGHGLSGSVYGKRAKVDVFGFQNIELKRVNVAFPDSTSISFARKFKSRSGTISGEILKRFNIIYDYANSTMTLKKNRFFGNPFYYNKSGITLEHDGVRVVKEVDKNSGISRFDSNQESVATASLIAGSSYKYVLAPSYKIVELRIDSPAHKTGLQLGDVILNINNKDAHEFTMQEIIKMFYDENGKRIKMLIDRKGVQMKYEFKLESMF